jgi:hypothetical protein
VNQFMAKAGPSHWMAVKRILRYLKGIFKWALWPVGQCRILVGIPKLR